MTAWRRYSVLALAGVLALAAAPRLDCQNPNGFIRSDAWACLVPLVGLDCAGGGPEAMLADWVAPYDLSLANPVVGTVWNDIEFGATAKSPGWRGPGDPTFLAIPAGPDPDSVDFDAYLVAEGLPSDFVMAIAVTYVRNKTGAALPVGVCTTSDDSIQVWVNNTRVVNVSICRAIGLDCSEVSPAVLAPGVNRITAAIWDGYGGFGFRLGFTRPDGSKYTQTDAELEFLGAGDSTGVVGALPILTRQYPRSDVGAPGSSLRVTLSGDGDFPEGATYGVTEELYGDVEGLAISGISARGVLGDIGPAPPREGEFFHGVVGTPCSPDNFTSFDGSRYTTHATTSLDIWTGGDTFEMAYEYVEGDLDLAVEIVEKHFPAAGRWGKFGLMARQTLDGDSKFGHIQDHGPDLQDPARYARRVAHRVVGSMEEPMNTGNMVDPNDGSPLTHPRYLRLTRRGDLVESWVSNTAGDLGIEPEADTNWALVYSDDWTGAPISLFAGFAYSVHESTGCASGEIVWRPVTCQWSPVTLPPMGKRLAWSVTGSELNSGLTYTATAPRGMEYLVQGACGSAQTAGAGLLSFQNEPTGPLGQFEDSHDIGKKGPCGEGSTVHDDRGTPDSADDVYTLTAGGLDVWANGDQFQYAYKKVQGDFGVQAKFTSVGHPPSGSRWGKYGLMARWNATQNSSYFFAHNAGATRFNCEIDGPRTAYRPRSGYDGGNGEPDWVWWQDVLASEPMDAACLSVNPDMRANDLRGDERNMAPFLRLVRRGNAFYGYGSDDGRNWRVLGSYSWSDAPREVLAGVAATSHADCELIRVTFQDLRFEELPPVERRITGDDPPDGTVMILSDFESGRPNACPDGWICNRWGSLGAFRAQGVNGRLRMGNIKRSALGRGDDNSSTAFLDAPIDPTGAFLFEFDLFFSYDINVAGDNNPPADGLTFCMLGTSTGTENLDLRVGDRGGGLGYGRINLSLKEDAVPSRTFSLNSFAVEFDTWHNGEVWNEGDGANVSGWNQTGGSAGTGTGAYHVGLDVAAAPSSVQRNHQMGVHDDDLPDIFDPAGIHVWILYDRGHVKTWLRSNAAGASPDRKLVLDDEIEPVELNSPQALVGFTSGTGAATCIMEVDNFVANDLLKVPGGFHRGDANDDGQINITDGIYVLNFLFLGGSTPPCAEAANPNDDASLNITDGIYVLNFLFLGGPAPAEPGPVAAPCGVDPPGSPTNLGCASYTHCE